MEQRLKTKIWIQAQLRLCDQQFIPFMILKKGDPDAGTILLKICDRDRNCVVYSQARTLSGAPAWRRGTGSTPVSDETAQNYISRQQQYDSDLWVVEVEDRDNKFKLDAEIID